MADTDEQHRHLAQGAVRHARAHLADIANGTATGYTLTTDVVLEAGCAWQGTGLLHNSYSERDIDEIARAIVGRVATVLVMVGWTPPAHLLDNEETHCGN